MFMPWKDPMELLSKLGDFFLEKVLIIVPVVVISLIAIKIIMKMVDRMLGRLWWIGCWAACPWRTPSSA